MRVGIVTFHKADNYGAVLQAYALQKTLSDLDVDGVLLDFRGPEPKGGPPSEAGKGSHALVERLRTARKARAALFEAFRVRHLRCSSPVLAEQAVELNGLYDFFMTGSDQVWNLSLPETDERYFLPFAPPEKRVSYAASFGIDVIPDELKKWYTDRLIRFRAISVREERGREIVRELTGRDCEVCLDPVFLLDRADWRPLIAARSETPYLFLYMVGYDGTLAACAQREAEERGLELRIATAGFIPQYGLASWSDVSVEQWLSLIYGCSGVFTNSFHCTAFAMIFGRPVTTAMLRDGLSQRNGRLEELLGLCGMEHQKGPVAISAEDFALRIRAKKQSSIDFLHSSLRQNSAC